MIKSVEPGKPRGAASRPRPLSQGTPCCSWHFGHRSVVPFCSGAMRRLQANCRTTEAVDCRRYSGTKHSLCYGCLVAIARSFRSATDVTVATGASDMPIPFLAKAQVSPLPTDTRSNRLICGCTRPHSVGGTALTSGHGVQSGGAELHCNRYTQGRLPLRSGPRSSGDPTRDACCRRFMLPGRRSVLCPQCQGVRLCAARHCCVVWSRAAHGSPLFSGDVLVPARCYAPRGAKAP